MLHIHLVAYHIFREVLFYNSGWWNFKKEFDLSVAAFLISPVFLKLLSCHWRVRAQGLSGIWKNMFNISYYSQCIWGKKQPLVHSPGKRIFWFHNCISNMYIPTVRLLKNLSWLLIGTTSAHLRLPYHSENGKEIFCLPKVNLLTWWQQLCLPHKKHNRQNNIHRYN